MKAQRPDKLRILFVCYGNICRSPMAVGIANKRPGGSIVAESAGIRPAGDKASPEAVIAMKVGFGADISGHRPKHFADVSPEAFDYVIAMDLMVYNRLVESRRFPDKKLFVWDIEDPLGFGVDVYRHVAQKIEARLEQFLENIEAGR
ncbi:MAG: low molecular weight phosphatase family protein [Acidobacteriota bacterium]|nr:low molecular weight phosphatase family protein [Acidobacteriota bacterium]